MVLSIGLLNGWVVDGIMSVTQLWAVDWLLVGCALDLNKNFFEVGRQEFVTNLGLVIGEIFFLQKFSVLLFGQFLHVELGDYLELLDCSQKIQRLRFVGVFGNLLSPFFRDHLLINLEGFKKVFHEHFANQPELIQG